MVEKICGDSCGKCREKQLLFPETEGGLPVWLGVKKYQKILQTTKENLDESCFLLQNISQDKMRKSQFRGIFPEGEVS